MIWSLVQRDIDRQELRVTAFHPKGTISGIIALVPALIPGLAFGWLAYRLLKTLKLRCPKCSWCERYKISINGQAAPTSNTSMQPPNNSSAPSNIDRLFAEIGSAPPAPPRTGDDEESNADVSAWVYGEIANGKSPEEVSAQLREMGWQSDTAEHLAEIGRRQTRHLRR